MFIFIYEISCVCTVFQALQCDEWPDGEPPLDAEVDLWDDCRMDVSYIFMDLPMRVGYMYSSHMHG